MESVIERLGTESFTEARGVDCHQRQHNLDAVHTEPAGILHTSLNSEPMGFKRDKKRKESSGKHTAIGGERV
jgi:hypothetical protein